MKAHCRLTHDSRYRISVKHTLFSVIPASFVSLLHTPFICYFSPHSPSESNGLRMRPIAF